MSERTLKGYTADTHRTVPTDETLARVAPVLQQMGITRIANVTGLDRIGIPVVMVSRPNSRSVAVSQGKGLSLTAAKASGVMEAIESWHAERISLPVRYASYRDIVGEAAVADVSRLPRVRNSRFSDTLRTLWIEGVDLMRQEARWVPYEMVHTDYTRPVPPGHGCFACSTNGLASGNHVLEATCHALCEVIERDATSLWHHLSEPGRNDTRIVPGTIDDALCREVIDRLVAAAFDFAIWETTSDIGVAAFHCVIAEADGRNGHIGIGGGCHAHRGIALLRALTEAVQTRMTYVSGARDDLQPEEFSAQAIAQKCGFAAKAMNGYSPVRDFADCPHCDFDNFEDELDWLLARLTAAGCAEAVVVDLTRPEIGIPVVRAIIPGLEAPHDEDDYLPGPRAGAAERGEA